MGKLNIANLKKTYYYCKKNGVTQAVMAAAERMITPQESYIYEEISAQRIIEQRETVFSYAPKISIVVPLYNTPRSYFVEMITSVLTQTYQNLELVLVDASTSEYLQSTDLAKIIEDCRDDRIVYKRLEKNHGISGNTNEAVELATGEYIGLLDHDDILTIDALFEVVLKLNEVHTRGEHALFLYSDEDKCNGNGTICYDPNRKPAMDLDYLWSNNYICHFSVFEADLLKRLSFRKEYDGAQDYDVILRAVRASEEACLQVHNISKVLYHWRCHEDSTAVNPQSKLYAYEAGKRAVEDDLEVRGICAKVTHSKHLGFYEVDYTIDMMTQRDTIGMITYPQYAKGHIVGGARSATGQLLYGGLRKGFSGGYLHRAAVFQQCECADIDPRFVREGLLEEFFVQSGKSEQDLKTIDCMVQFAAYLRKKGYVIVYNPRIGR